MECIDIAQSRAAYVLWLAAAAWVLLTTGFTSYARANSAPQPPVHAGPVMALADNRNPEDFACAIAPPPTMPPVIFSREDAVARELIANSHTMSRRQALRTAQALCDEARRLGYDPLLFVAVISVESSFNHLAVSPMGAEGLMQLMPDTAEFMAAVNKLSRTDGLTFDPVWNVRLGARYLATLNRMFQHHLDEALTAYNRGPANTRFILLRHGTLPANIRAFYSDRVLDKYRQLKKVYGNRPYA